MPWLFLFLSLLKCNSNHIYFVHSAQCLIQSRHLKIYVNWINKWYIYWSIINYPVLYFRNCVFEEMLLHKFLCSYISFCLCQECKALSFCPSHFSGLYLQQSHLKPKYIFMEAHGEAGRGHRDTAKLPPGAAGGVATCLRWLLWPRVLPMRKSVDLAEETVRGKKVFLPPFLVLLAGLRIKSTWDRATGEKSRLTWGVRESRWYGT